MFAQGL